MRTALVIGLSTLALIGGLGPSEARFKMRLPVHTGTVRPVATAPGPTVHGQAARVAVAAAVAASPRVRTAEALAPGEAGDIGFLRRSDSAELPSVKKEAAPWCPDGQIAGSGAGFCIIN